MSVAEVVNGSVVCVVRWSTPDVISGSLGEVLRTPPSAVVRGWSVEVDMSWSVGISVEVSTAGRLDAGANLVLTPPLRTSTTLHLGSQFRYYQSLAYFNVAE